MKTRTLRINKKDGLPEGPSMMFAWNANPYNVMNGVEEVLKQYGFEVIRYETGTNSYCFDIIKKATKKA